MKNKLRNYILAATLGTLAMSSVITTIETATSGVQMSKLEKDKELLVKERKELEEQLVKSMSLSELSNQSSALGFVKAEELVYITPSDSIAKLPR